MVEVKRMKLLQTPILRSFGFSWRAILPASRRFYVVAAAHRRFVQQLCGVGWLR